MSNSIMGVVIKAGLVSQNYLAELKRWGYPVPVPEEVPDLPSSLEERKKIAKEIQDVLESEEFVSTKETDLNLLQEYFSTQTSGRLFIENDIETTSSFDVVFGVTQLNEYILPYQGENISGLLANGLSYLEVAPTVSTPTRKIYFSDVREVFLGEMKAFVVCTPSGGNHG